MDKNAGYLNLEIVASEAVVTVDAAVVAEALASIPGTKETRTTCEDPERTPRAPL